MFYSVETQFYPKSQLSRLTRPDANLLEQPWFSNHGQFQTCPTFFCSAGDMAGAAIGGPLTCPKCNNICQMGLAKWSGRRATEAPGELMIVRLKAADLPANRCPMAVIKKQVPLALGDSTSQHFAL